MIPVEVKQRESTMPKTSTAQSVITGGKRTTMGDVAAHLGVSRSLVSLVLSNTPGPSEKTREKVLQAAHDLGYRPDTAAQTLRRGRSHHLGVLFTMSHPHDVALVEQIYPAAEALGYEVALGAIGPRRDERKAVESLLSYRIEALILIGPYLGSDHVAHLVDQLPIVEIGRRSPTDSVDSIRTADNKGAQQAIDHLVELGHRDIVHVDGGNLPGAEERRRGYRAAMRRHGLTGNIRVLPGDYSEESGARAARTLLAGPLPTAVFAGNDRCAHGLLVALVRSGLQVPSDVSVVGYDNSPIAGMSFIDLTTVGQDASAMAELAVEAATQRLDDGRRTRRDIVLEPSLIVRGSTASARPADGTRLTRS